MDWCKLSLYQINEFLLKYQESEEKEFSQASAKADILFNKISPQFPRPVLNLYLASYLKPDDISQIFSWASSPPNSLFTNLPEDIHRLICLQLDYDDLINYLQVQKILWLLGKEDRFWLNKIYYDFAINNRVIGPQSYVKIAAEHYYPVKGCHKYAHSFRDIFRLLYNANKLGKSGKFLQDKLSSFEVSDDINGILKIASVIGTKILNLDETVNIIKSQLTEPRLIPSVNYYYNLAVILRGDKCVPGEVIYWRNMIIYASLFDRLDILKEFFSSGELKYETVVPLSTSSTIEIIRGWAPERFSLHMHYIACETIRWKNIEGLKKLVDLGLDINDYILHLAIDSNYRDMITYILDCYWEILTKYTLDELLYTSVKHNNLESATLLLELGADINMALHGAAANNSSMIVFYVKSGASDLDGALLHAIRENQVYAVEILTSIGATNLDQAVATLIEFDNPQEINKSKIMTILVNTGKVNLPTAMVKLVDKLMYKRYYDEDEKLLDTLMQTDVDNVDKILFRLIKEYSTNHKRNHLELIDKIISAEIIDRDRAWKLARKYNNDDVLNILSI